MDEKTRSSYATDKIVEGEESQSFLPSVRHFHQGRVKQSSFYSLTHIITLYASNVLLIIVVLILWFKKPTAGDPSLAVWSPANSAVEYIDKHHFRAALFNFTEYMGYPTADGRTDQLWSDLYNFGISKITKEEASHLPNPTLPIPGTEDYLIQLDVWHELHCLNDLRKILYPEVYGGLEDVKHENGTINRDTDMFRHWEHCVDSIRQTLMCHADVAPIPFHIKVPANFGVFPRLATTHTCKNFAKIQEWARDHWAGEWDFNVTPDKAQEIIENSGFDNSPEEDIQFLYKLFPGNKWFEYWRVHEVDDEEGSP